MAERSVLITGGAGFIGSFLTEALLERGKRVRIVDNLEEQVHHGKKPAYLSPHAEFIKGDVRDVATVERALQNIDTVIHCASAVGVGQSQYEIKRYNDVNVGGMANILDVIVNKKLPVHTMLLPASMTCYGEGLYTCAEHGSVRPGLRAESDVKAGDYRPHCPVCRAHVTPVPTPEDAAKQAASVYALTKSMQEELMLNICRTYEIRTASLRLFNVYGPRQSLSNPYTGVSAIFLSRLKNSNPPVVYEDGRQSRDFISVQDVVRAFLCALDTESADGQAFNIGSGVPTPILGLAKTLGTLTGIDIAPELPGTYRKNDVCHCFADIQRARTALNWQPRVSLEQGLDELIAWSKNEEAVDSFEAAAHELRNKSLQS